MANVNFKVYKRITNGLVDYLVLPGTNTPYGMSEANPSEANAWFQSHPQQLQAVKSDMPQYGGTAQQVDQLLQGSQVASGWSQRVDPITGQTNWGQWDVVDAKQRAYDAEIAAGTMERVPIGGGQFGYKKTAAGLAQLQSQLGQTGNISTPPTGGAASAGGTTPQNGSGQFGPSSYTGVSLRDYLASKGQPTGFSAQRILAQRFGIPNYTGTAEQNTQLLAKLRAEGTTPPAGGAPGTTPPPTTAPGGTGAPTTGVSPPTTVQPPTGGFQLTAGNLKQGSTGPNVSQLQQILKDKGLYTGAIDGKFGPLTLAAVKAFQQSQGLAADGIVGPLTTAKLNEISAPPAPTGAPGGEGEIPPPGQGPGETSLTPAETEYSTYLQQKTFNDYVDAFSQQLNLPALQTSITAANVAYQGAQDKKLKDAEDINSNPWISESLRGKKIANNEIKHEAKLLFAQKEVERIQRQYNDAQEEVRFAAKMAVEQQNKDREFYLATKKAAADLAFKAQKEATRTEERDLLSPSEAATLNLPYGTTKTEAATMGITPTKGKTKTITGTTQIININGKKYLVDKVSGNIIKEIKPGEKVTPGEIPAGKKPIRESAQLLTAAGLAKGPAKPGFLSRVKQFFAGKGKKKTYAAPSAISPAGTISWDNF